MTQLLVTLPETTSTSVLTKFRKEVYSMRNDISLVFRTKHSFDAVCLDGRGAAYLRGMVCQYFGRGVADVKYSK